VELDRWIRGCDPVPAAWTELRGVPVQLFSPEPRDEPAEAPAGVVVEASPRTGLVVATGTGRIRIGEVKPAGKARMSSASWIAGRGAASGDRFG
jgi:methionyl-tRNA formyltransferase